MQVKMKWLKTAYGVKLQSLDNYEDKQAFMQFMNGKFDEWHAEMMNWQPGPKGDSIEEVLEIIEDAVTGELPDSLKPDEDKPKKRGKK